MADSEAKSPEMDMARPTVGPEADAEAKSPEMEQARPTVGPKAVLRPRGARSKPEEQAEIATENSYLTSAAHQKDQNARISLAEGRGDLAIAGMQQSKEHVETMLRKVEAQCEEMYRRDVYREG